MAKFPFFVVIAATSLIWPAVAQAGPTGRQALQRVSDCVVARHQTEALDLFFKKISSVADYERQNKILLDELPDCLKKTGGPFGAGIRMTPTDFDEMIAGSLVRALYGPRDPGDLGTIPYSKRPTIEGFDNPISVHSSRERQAMFRVHVGKVASYLRELVAECVVRSNSAESRRLLLTEADSPQEAAAFSALSSDLKACIPQSFGLQFPGSDLRNSMAIFYLSLANIQAMP